MIVQRPDACRPAAARRGLRVRRVVADVRDVVLVDLEPERVLEAHRIDLRPRLVLRHAGHEREEVPGRDRVRPARPKSALLASPAAMSSSLTLIRSTLPRRSFVFNVERRASPVGRWNQPPGWTVAFVTVGVVPVRPVASPVSCGWSACCSACAEEHVDVRRVHGAAARLDVVGADVRERLQRGVDLGAGRVERERAGRLAVEGQREGATGRVLTRTVCSSSVSWSLNGP